MVVKETILKQLNKLDISKSPGPDNIDPRIITKPLHVCILYNTSLKAKKIQLDWKHLHMRISHIEKGNKSIAINYTYVLCKMLEHLIKNHMMHFLEIIDLITVNQFCFVRGKSTGLQLLELKNKWIWVLNNKYQVDILKAFDTVPHLRLLNKLKSVGTVGPMLE